MGASLHWLVRLAIRTDLDNAARAKLTVIIGGTVADWAVIPVVNVDGPTFWTGEGWRFLVRA
jgi:hypothetical protein